MPPPTELTSDALLDIIACLPLGAIARLVQVQSAWKILVYANESTVYHNAAMLHRFVPSVNTTLDDAVSTLDFDTSSLSIAGWKQFCRLRLGIERNWTGFGPSQMRNIGAIGENIHQRKTIPHSEYTITAALRYISVHDDADGIVWKLPENYFQSFPYFAYDAGYLALPNHLLNTIEIWREPSTEMLPYAPSPVQKIAAEATAAVYGAPAGGHFVPCYTLRRTTTQRILQILTATKGTMPTVSTACQICSRSRIAVIVKTRMKNQSVAQTKTRRQEPRRRSSPNFQKPPPLRRHQSSNC
ncbi:hypothetical protein K438DRAFT_1009387 [Mycena galopus ATCC 62051]|nr:hypothetical protein K438DRAFT_1009387 [Mycena galopus ATCC 62051]